jgi:hypothetical protein
MSRYLKAVVKTCTGAAVALAVAGPAWAVDLTGNAAALQNDLQALENRLQRQQFQQQQQQFRQQDRQMVPQVQRPEVPHVGQNCRVQVYGNSYTTICR